ncbi:MAG: chromosome segregation protein SMC [Ruminococcaceae bacterium]|nr:chromosome segregation protein SMC [Oscillospiraceae bacterium]
MLLSSIQIQGFKSFADKTVLKFGRGITAVVGPNGSGKSNISDAVRWVLGEQSTKSLRGQSMEDVIFGGTDNRRPHGFCEVTLNIDNADRTLNFDNDFVSITRRFYRSHESEYLINNVSVRLKDVHELFMDTGLGRDGYSMIGQGKIDNIISTKSDERRDIFEEASGISKYRYRKTEAERKLASAEDNMLRLKDILDELESRVGPLEEQSKKAEKFLMLAEDKKQLEIGLWLYTLNNSKDALRSQESKIATAQMQYKEIEEALNEFDTKSEENTAQFTFITSQIENIRQRIALSNEETVKFEGEISVLNNDILHNKENIDRLNSEKKALEESDTSAKQEIENKRNLAVEKQKLIDELNIKLSDLENNLNNLLTDSESISRKIEEQIKTLNLISANTSDLRVEMTTSNTSIEEINSRRGIIEELLKQNDSEKQILIKDFDETKDLLDKTEDSILSLQNSLKGYELRLQNRNDELKELTDKSNELHLDIEAKRRRVQILTELENNMEGFSNAVKKVVAESDKGVLRGVHGPLSKLITVDKKYSVAIETALGNALQNIVVDTDADAKRGINFLKTNNFGRATFLPISSITSREFKDNDFDDVYGYIGVASDLVEVDKKYTEIVKHLLAGTVVTEDIDSATTLAKKYNYKVKVVSLDGQVINVGGSFTGGSLVKQAGMLSRAADIKRINDDIEKLSEKEKSTQKLLDAAVSAVSEVNADIVAVKADLTNANEDKIRAIAELKRIDDLINNINNVINSLNDERDGSEEKIKLLNEKANTASIKINELELQKSSIQAEIDLMTGGRDSLSQNREALTNDITNIKLQIIENKKDFDSLTLSANDIENSISNRAARLSEIEAEIAAINYKIVQLNSDISSHNDEIDDIKHKIIEYNNDIDKLMNERNSVEKSGVELRASERERTLEREKIGGELARLTERKEVMMKEYDDVIRQLFDEYQLTKSEAENIAIQIEKPAEAKKQLAETKSKIRALGNVNVSAIEEYKEVKERYDFMNEQMQDIEKARTELRKLINQLTSQMQEMFVEGFAKINENFTKTFRELFGGGSAELKLTDPENVLESGIDIEARLPGKNVPSLNGLSGGEKALVALSIYFAIMKVNAPPFCFLDEVDTALDDINVDRFADYMKRSDFNTQFICVTHRRGTMEQADMLYGVTMQEKGVTKLLELNVAELEKKLLENQGA